MASRDKGLSFGVARELHWDRLRVLALRKVVEALGIVRGEPSFLGLSDTVWLLAIVALLVVSYTVVGGLWAVVMTDLVQLVLALLGAWRLLSLLCMQRAVWHHCSINFKP